MRISTLCPIVIGAIFITTSAFGAGFQISEQSVTGLGRAFAGAGVAGESISDQFFNPASLHLRQGRELELALHILDLKARFENRGSTLTLNGTTGPVTVPATGANADGGGTAIVPNLYFADTLNDEWRYGLGITAPFGLVTEYDADFIGRYTALKSELTTVELTPAIAHRNGNYALGLGLVLLSADAELTDALFTGADTADGLTRLEGDDTAIGYTLGFIGENDYGRAGLSLRSALTIDIDGTLNITPAGIATKASTTIVLPQTFYLSGLLKARPNLDLVASIRYTDWSKFDEIRIAFANGLPDAVTQNNWSSTRMLSAGVVYKASRWTWRGGIAYDEGAVSDTYRITRIPDTNRRWLSLGASYHPNKKFRVDFGYAHIFTSDAPVTQTTDLVATSPGLATHHLRGRYTDTDANIFSIALNIRFGK